jgi:hypothetical protein
MMALARRSLLTVCVALSAALSLGCEDSGKKSAALAAEDLPFLIRATDQDVSEVRSGLPEGAPHLVQLFEERRPEQPAFEALHETLGRARDKTQDLRVAKSTFFAVATPDGKILRNDQKQDLMAGKMLFESFPELKKALEAGYTETRGSMPEAAGVKGKPDAQWVAAVPLRSGDDSFGLYVTGWSFSAYAYRLETALRSELISKLKEREKLPLTYVYVVVGDQAYGAPVSPEVNAKAVLESNPKEQLQSQDSYTVVKDIDGRRFGIAVGRAKSLGEDVAIALVRSET